MVTGNGHHELVKNSTTIRLNGAASDTHIGAHGALTQNAILNIHTGWRMDSIGTYCQE